MSANIRPSPKHLPAINLPAINSPAINFPAIYLIPRNAAGIFVAGILRNRFSD
jgi:hypothetical protein